MRVLSGALRVLVRREVSLNRRLYFLLLGVNPAEPNARSSAEQRAYFTEHARARVLRALSDAYERAATLSSSALAVQPFKVLVGLLERAEIGEALIADTLPHVLRAMQRALSLIGSSESQQRALPASPSASAGGGSNGDYVDALSAARAVVAEALALLEALRAELVWARLAALAQVPCPRVPVASSCAHDVVAECVGRGGRAAAARHGAAARGVARGSARASAQAARDAAAAL